MKRIIALLFVIISLFSCQKAPFLTLNTPSSISFSEQGGTQDIIFQANRNWSASSSESWCKVSPASGTASNGPVSVTVRCDANTTYDDRTAMVTITIEELSQTVTVSQPANLGIVLPTQAYDLQSDAKTIEVTVQANVDYTVETSVDWVKQTGTRGLTSKTLNFRVEENKTFDAREGIITIKPKQTGVAEQVISVKQAQKDALNVEKTSYEMPYGGGEIEIKVEANVAFEVFSNSDWIQHISTKALSGSTVLLKIDANTTYDAREGYVEITHHNGSLKHTISVEQQQAPGLFVNPNSFDLTYEAQEIELKVRNNVSLDIVIPDEAKDWITLKTNTQTKALVEDKVGFAITMNGASTNREATLVIKQVDGSLSENVVISQGHFEGLEVSQSIFNVDKESHTIEFSVYSSKEYDISNSSQWWLSEISRTVVNPIETHYVFSIKENTDTSPRIGTITYKFKTGEMTVNVSVSQEPTYYIQHFDFFGALSSFEQNFNLGFESNAKPLTYSCNKEWIRYVTDIGSSLYPRPVFIVDENTSRSEREAIITVKSAKEGVSLEIKVIQNGVREVPEGTTELGLSVLWATCNVGASSPEEFGGYYAWGELEEKDNYSWSTYRWGNGYASVTKYTQEDEEEVLKKEDDVASVKLGGHWHIPTNLQWREIFNRCARESETINGVGCLIFTSPITGNKLIIPNAGYKNENNTYGSGIYAKYWTSTRNESYDNKAWNVNTGLGTMYAESRCAGMSIRPVYE